MKGCLKLLFVGLLMCFGSTALAQGEIGAPPGEDALDSGSRGTTLVPAIPPEFNRPVSDYHIVKPGDTLFDISNAYFGTPYVWPILWSFNAHISNPHWIYPNDIVYLRAPLPGDAPGGDNGPGPLVAANRGLSLGVGAFITGRAVSSVGKIEKSIEGKEMLTFPDRVYFSLNSGEQSRVKKGKVYAILRDQGLIQENEKDIGTRFKVVGAVRVVEVGDGRLHTALIVQAWEEIYRGDLIFPYERQLLRVAPTVSNKTVVGKIIDTLDRTELFGQHFYVFINKGENDGVRVGNRFFTYFRSDGLSNLDKDNVKNLPFERIAQILVIQAEDNYSTGLVVESIRELDVGMRVEMYEGF